MIPEFVETINSDKCKASCEHIRCFSKANAEVPNTPQGRIYYSRHLYLKTLINQMQLYSSVGPLISQMVLRISHINCS